MRIGVYNSLRLKWLPKCSASECGDQTRIKRKMTHTAPAQKNRIHAENWLSERDPLCGNTICDKSVASNNTNNGFKMLRENDQ